MRVLAALSLAALAAGACSGSRPIESAAAEPDEPEAPVLLGVVTREEIEAVVPEWVAETVQAAPDVEASMGLAAAGQAASVRVYLGTWCSDSRRELGRLWRALDDVGGLVPFSMQYVGVDREKAEPRELVEGSGLELVPTFVVTANGREVGRIVEESPNGIETDLLALLRGEASGLISATVGAETPEDGD